MDSFTNYEIALIAGGFGVACALLGAWATYRLSLHLARTQSALARTLADREAMRNAASNLRAAFAPQLSDLRVQQHLGTSITDTEVRSWLTRCAYEHAIEMEKFRFYLSSQERPAYDKACREYQDIARLQAAPDTKTGHPQKLIESHIDAILKFAQP